MPETYTIHQGDCLDVLPTLPEKSCQCCVCSPPYMGLRAYLQDDDPDKAKEIGLEPTPSGYVAKMVRVFREVKRILRDDGCVFINIGDSYAGGGRGSGYSVKQDGNKGTVGMPRSLSPKGMSGKSLLLIPQRLAIALQDDGWIVRSIIIWAKGISGNVRMGSCMPESVTDRPATSHEYILMLAKQERYYYDAEAVEEVATGYDGRHDTMYKGGEKDMACTAHERWRVSKKNDSQYDKPYTGQATKEYAEAGVQNPSDVKRRIVESKMLQDNPYVATRRSVWQVNPQPSSVPHFAMMPEKLAEPMILAGCPVGGVVLDPFCGAGTTGVVAVKKGRSFVGVELSEKYAAISRQRIGDASSQGRLFNA
jgi:DNA modification methylase